jgi:biotin carboxyl carrier protein
MIMPIYEVFIDAKLLKLELTKTTENTFIVNIDATPAKVELETKEFDLERPFKIKVDNKTYHVRFEKTDREKPFTVKVDEASFSAEARVPAMRTPTTTFRPTPAISSTKKTGALKDTASGAITAPMTGKIISLKVKKGDQVKQNQVLCIIEAMKMENEITASKAGTVQEVNVSEGESVNEGETIFVLN